MIKFIEKTHQYVDQENKTLISVSKFTESFKEKTDWKAVAKRVATKVSKETGVPTTTQDILDKWDNKRDKASSIGTRFHTIREEALISEESPKFYGKECTTKACITKEDGKYSIPINNLENNTVYPELMIYDLENMLCGQADKVIVTGNKINIWDYKTDESIKFKGYSSQWTKAKRMLGPLKHLEECNANTYSIKMSLYMYMLWKANKGKFLPGDLIIEHVTLKRDPENDNIPVLDSNGDPIVLKIENIKLPYRKKEVEQMLKTLKK